MRRASQVCHVAWMRWVILDTRGWEPWPSPPPALDWWTADEQLMKEMIWTKERESATRQVKPSHGVSHQQNISQSHSTHLHHHFSHLKPYCHQFHLQHLFYHHLYQLQHLLLQWCSSLSCTAWGLMLKSLSSMDTLVFCFSLCWPWSAW